jgi:hypothetical protein
MTASTTTASPVRFINEDVYSDGAYCALTVAYGIEFAVHYISREIRVYGTAGLRGARKWQIRSAAEAVKTEVARRINAFGPEFAARHDALYAEEG